MTYFDLDAFYCPILEQREVPPSVSKKIYQMFKRKGLGGGVKGILNNIKKLSLGNYAVIVLSRDRATEGNLRRK